MYVDDARRCSVIEQVARDVAGDRAIDVLGDAARSRSSSVGRSSAKKKSQDLLAVEQQEERHRQDRHELDQRAEDADGDVLQRAGGVAELRGQLLGLLARASG